MKTIVLDDDPTGTQAATGVTVLLVSDAGRLTAALRDADSVYVQTNSRAIGEAEARALVAQIRTDGEEAGRRLGEEVSFVLRGDSTLRGHVFAETEEFLDADGVMLFVPAFPAGGRTTRGGVHHVRIGDVEVPAHESEFAADPVFGFSSGALTEYIAEKSGRSTTLVPLDVVRSGGLAGILTTVEAGSVVAPDAVDDDDIRLIAEATQRAREGGASIVVRCAAPLAAELAGCASNGLLATPLLSTPPTVLLAAGSHTSATTAQLARLAQMSGEPVVIGTDEALVDPVAAGAEAGERVKAALGRKTLAVLSTERRRRATHDTLGHGERVMAALTTAVRAALPDADAVVAKGGITSAEVARVGLGADSAFVLGQVLPGISVWRLTAFDGRELLYVVVPGNVGEADTLVEVLRALGWDSDAAPI